VDIQASIHSVHKSTHPTQIQKNKRDVHGLGESFQSPGAQERVANPMRLLPTSQAV